MIHFEFRAGCVYRLRRSRRALRFLLPILRRRRGLAIRVLLCSGEGECSWWGGLRPDAGRNSKFECRASEILAGRGRIKLRSGEIFENGSPSSGSDLIFLSFILIVTMGGPLLECVNRVAL